MDEIKQFIKTAKEPTELQEYTTLLYDAFISMDDKTYKTIKCFFDDSNELFFDYK